MIRFYFVFIIKSKPRFVFFESISFFKIPLLYEDSKINIDSRKREITVNTKIINLLVIELFFSFFGC